MDFLTSPKYSPVSCMLFLLSWCEKGLSVWYKSRLVCENFGGGRAGTVFLFSLFVSYVLPVLVTEVRGPTLKKSSQLECLYCKIRESWDRLHGEDLIVYSFHFQNYEKIRSGPNDFLI